MVHDKNMFYSSIAVLGVASALIVAAFYMPTHAETWFGLVLSKEAQDTTWVKYAMWITGGVGMPLGAIGVIGGK